MFLIIHVVAQMFQLVTIEKHHKKIPIYYLVFQTWLYRFYTDALPKNSPDISPVEPKGLIAGIYSIFKIHLVVVFLYMCHVKFQDTSR